MGSSSRGIPRPRCTRACRTRMLPRRGARSSRGASSCCSSPPSGCWATGFSLGSCGWGSAMPPRAFPASPSTRPTASAIGGMIFDPSTGRIAELRDVLPGVPMQAFTATATPRSRGHRPAASHARSRGARGHVRSPEPDVSRRATQRQRDRPDRGSSAASPGLGRFRRRRDRLLHEPQADRRRRGQSQRPRFEGRGLPRRHGLSGTPSRAGSVLLRAAQHRRRHRGVRHGDRSR